MDGKVLTERQGLGNVPVKEPLDGGNRGWAKTRAKEAKEIGQLGTGNGR